MTVASRWASSHLFMFESNCNSLMTWVVDPLPALWCFHAVLRKCCHIFTAGISWSLSHIGRMRNKTADVLAKMGSDRFNFIEFA